MIAEREFAGRQSLGRRATQQDSYAFAEIGMPGRPSEGLLLVLADGMGGHKGGERASDLAVQHFVYEFQNSDLEAGDRFEAGLEAANSAISEAIKISGSEFQGMGTTLLAVTFAQQGLEWLSVGDCALYLLRGEEIRRLNADHSCRSQLEEQVRRGEKTAEEAATDPDRTKLRSALMGGQVAMVDCSLSPFPLLPGDLIVAASDGLEAIPRTQLLNLLIELRSLPAGESAALLLRAVEQRDHPKQDNTTVAVVKPRDAELRNLSPAPNRSRDGSGNYTPTRQIVDASPLPL